MFIFFQGSFFKWFASHKDKDANYFAFQKCLHFKIEEINYNFICLKKPFKLTVVKKGR